MLACVVILILFLHSAESQVCDKRNVTAAEVEAFLAKLIAEDVNGGGEDEVVVNFQALGTYNDHSPAPLFTSVSERIRSGRTFKAFEALQSLYIANTSVPDPNTPLRLNAINNFLDAVLETEVMKAAWDFLADADRASKDERAFKQQLFDLWFEPYHRDYTDGSSSGFEHVFVGEKDIARSSEIGNWYRFYLLEQTKNVNYYGYEEKAEGTGIKLGFAWDGIKSTSGFRLGTSPELDLGLLTVCAAAYDKVQSEQCDYHKNGFRIWNDAETKMFANDIESVWTSGFDIFSDSKQLSRLQNAEAITPLKPDVGLQELIDEMWAADEDRPTDYQLSWGNPQSGNKDTSIDPLIIYYDEEIFKKQQYVALNAMYDAGLGIFMPDVCIAENTMTGFRKQYIKTVFDTFVNTTVFQLALKYLQNTGKASEWSTFRSQLWALWMGTYSRCKGVLGSSGFEHVFCGEHNGTVLQGQHEWVKYYHLEKTRDIDYHGFYDHDEDLAGIIQYTWDGPLRKYGGISFATSPAFDFSVFTVCALTSPGCSGCKFNLDGHPVKVTSYTQPCNDGTCLTTAYFSV